MRHDVIALSEKFVGGRKSVPIEITPGGIHIIVDDTTISWPLSLVSLEKGGAGGDLIYIKNDSDPSLVLYTRDKNILKNEYLQLNSSTSEGSKSLRRKFAARKGVYSILLLLLIAIPLSFFVFRTTIVKKVASAVPVKWEVEAGDKLFEELKDNYNIVEDSVISIKFDSIFKPLVEAVNTPEIDYKFYLCSDPTLNAFALPGGHIVINYGTLMKIDRLEELYGVIGHELGHVALRHHLRGIISNLSTFLIFQGMLGDEAGLVGVIGESAGHLESLFYSRQFEKESDVAGYEYLVKANIDPTGMVEFFERIEREHEEREEEEKQRDIKNGDYDESDTLSTYHKLESFMSTHPGVRERIDYLNVRIQNEGVQIESKDFDLKKFQNFIQEKLDIE